jgi:predicted amidohydrolase YtcJ
MRRRLIPLMVCLLAAACGGRQHEPADLLLVNARVYTLSWPQPDADGRPAPGAPHDGRTWHPDADAIAIRAGRIVFVGRSADADGYRGSATEVRDLRGATVLPGLIDSHVHLAELGASLERVNLVGAATEEAVVSRVAARARDVPAGEWIVGWGWDEGAWANRYPDMRLLSERVPDHPVVLRGLHSFAVWGNRLAFERTGITAATPNPAGGEIKKDTRGQPTGILLNNAGALLMQAVPAPTPAQLDARLAAAFDALLTAGYVAVHEAGADTELLAALERADSQNRLPVRVYAMLAARDVELIDRWRQRAPKTDGRLVVRSVKAFYDGAMGSRGALFLEDYSDRPGHRGLGGVEYGFDRERLAFLMRRGYQITIHAIGDRANREALDFFAATIEQTPGSAATRPRIEHAQVVSAQDLPRFARLGVIASMQPSHAVEDMPWAEARVGPARLQGAYAWRSLRRAGAALALNSDLPGTDFNLFYGLHSAVTRRNRDRQPAGGWRPDERLTIEEAIRGWTTGAAHAGFEDGQAGVIAETRAADLTVIDLDPFTTADSDPSRLLSGRVLMTVAAGSVRVPKP